MTRVDIHNYKYIINILEAQWRIRASVKWDSLAWDSALSFIRRQTMAMAIADSLSILKKKNIYIYIIQLCSRYTDTIFSQ